jgi:hypothetical protein
MASTPANSLRIQVYRNTARVLNCLTILILMGATISVGIFFLIYLNPYLPLNPFPPPTLPATAFIPSPTATIHLNLPATWTPTFTLIPTDTHTPAPTATDLPTATLFTLLTPSHTPTSTNPPSGYIYEIQAGSPYYINNLYYPEKGCNWMGVGGQVVDMSGAPVTGLIIRLGGALTGLQLSPPLLSLTGVAPNYGQSGYEFTLADKPIASRASLWLQLLDQAGIALSRQFSFDTFAECEKNLIIINFKQVR